jgi:molybdate transport system permease protein
LAPLLISLKLAACTTAITCTLGLILAAWLTLSQSRFRGLVEAVATLPLVLPPTVLGFYLLVTFSPTAPLGAFIRNAVGQAVPFSFMGLLIGACVANIPFAVRPIAASFGAVPRNLIESAQLLGDSRPRLTRRVLIPMSRPGIAAAATLVFVHTLGEFGVALMIGGGIPERTETLSIRLYSRVQAMDFSSAHLIAGGLVLASFVALLLTPRATR